MGKGVGGGRWLEEGGGERPSLFTCQMPLARSAEQKLILESADGVKRRVESGAQRRSRQLRPAALLEAD